MEKNISKNEEEIGVIDNPLQSKNTDLEIK